MTVCWTATSNAMGSIWFAQKNDLTKRRYLLPCSACVTHFSIRHTNSLRHEHLRSYSQSHQENTAKDDESYCWFSVSSQRINFVMDACIICKESYCNAKDSYQKEEAVHVNSEKWICRLVHLNFLRTSLFCRRKPDVLAWLCLHGGPAGIRTPGVRSFQISGSEGRCLNPDWATGPFKNSYEPLKGFRKHLKTVTIYNS